MLHKLGSIKIIPSWAAGFEGSEDLESGKHVETLVEGRILAPFTIDSSSLERERERGREEKAATGR